MTKHVLVLCQRKTGTGVSGRVEDTVIPPINDFIKSILIINKKGSTKFDTILCSYKVLPYSLTKPFFHKDFKLIENPAPNYYNQFSYNAEEQKTDFLFTDKLSKNGSIARGVNFGNNQDLVVNSQLNLQLNGKLSERINILAAIADDNIPIQPDGNTQQLQEFDKVFIQLYDDKTKLTVGDYTLPKPAISYFSVYNKRSQGALINNAFRLKSDTNKIVAFSGAAAISRGKFNRYQLPIVEGNQGPYPLRGADNELFVIVLSLFTLIMIPLCFLIASYSFGNLTSVIIQLGITYSSSLFLVFL
jgi:hypothetical protein